MANPTSTLLLIRHGVTEMNLAYRFQGSSDPPLSALGREQASRLAPRLVGLAIDAVYSSDLQRAVETAEIALPRAGVQTTPLLREADYGVFEGLTYEEIRQRYPADLAAWERDREHAPPGGESLSDLVDRAQAFLDQLRGLGDGATTLAVSHGGLIRMLLCVALDLPAAQQWRFRIDNTAVSEILFTGRGAMLVRLNDTAHLEAGHRGASL